MIRVLSKPSEINHMVLLKDLRQFKPCRIYIAARACSMTVPPYIHYSVQFIAYVGLNTFYVNPRNIQAQFSYLIEQRGLYVSLLYACNR